MLLLYIFLLDVPDLHGQSACLHTIGIQDHCPQTAWLFSHLEPQIEHSRMI
jgi:hypothetical protein